MSSSKILFGCLFLLIAAGGFSVTRLSSTQREPSSASTATNESRPALSSAQRSALSTQQLGFIENKGQWDGQAAFLAQGNGVNLWLVQEGMVLDFHRFVPDANRKAVPRNRFARPTGTLQGDVVKMSFVNSHPTEISGQGEKQGMHNYFKGNDKRNWATNVRTFSEATARSPYDGVAVRYYFDEGMPRYDLIVSPHADTSQVAIQLEGAQGVSVLANGDLRIQTSIGPVEEKGLVAYQEIGGVRTQIPCRMIAEGNIVRFATGTYDKNSPLVIDPLIFSTYLGPSSGTGGQLPTGFALDAAGNPVVVGQSDATNYPTTTGAYQTTFKSYQDAFVTKLSADGTHLIYSSLISGTSFSQQAQAVAVDAVGEPVVVGWTFASDFPTTAGSFEAVGPGGQMAFVTKFSADGSKLIFSSFLAGGGNDVPVVVAFDSARNVVITGQCQDSNFPTTAGAFQTVHNGDSDEGFVTKVAANGASLVYSTYLGGKAYSVGDYPLCLALDSSGNAVVAGYTWSSDFPITAGAYQTKFAGVADGFIAKLASNGKSLTFSTFFGGDGSAISSIAFDKAGSIAAVGYTTSAAFPVTAGAYQPTLPGQEATFVSKLSSTGAGLISSTYLGGSTYDYAYSVAVDPAGDTVVTGQAQSPDFPTTVGSFQSAAPAYTNAFVSKVSPDAKSLLYSTFLGGNADELAIALALDAAGNPVVTGWTGSTDFPITANAYLKSHTTGDTLFVTKLDIAVHQKLAFTLNPTTIIGGSASLMTVTLTPAAPAGGAAVALTANGSSFYTLNVAAGSSTGAVNLTTNPVTSTEVILIGASYNGASATANLTIVPPALKALVVAPTAVTGGASATGTVSLTGPAPTGGKVVSLSSNKAAATVPTQVTVALNASSAAFTIHTTAVTAATAVTITSSMSGVSKTATLTVNLPTLVSLTMVPALVPSGRIGSGVVVLSGNAPTGGYVVLLSGGGSGVTFPVSVVVPAGAATASFKITTPLVDANLSVGVTAKFVTTKTATLTVIPASLYSLGFAPASVVGGASSTGYISLVGSAGPSGVLVTLSGGGSGVGFPATVKVPAGVSLQRFTVTTKHVATKTAVTITGKHGTVSKSAVLTVN